MNVAIKEKPIFVRCEWGELKECVYGGYDQYVFPKFLQDADVRPSGDFRQFWFENQEKAVRDADLDYYARWQSQIKGAVKVLKDSGIKVHLPDRISEQNMKFPRGENHGLLTGWLRDPFVTIANNVIELAPRSMFHRRQRFAIRHILASTMDRGARYFAQPVSGADDDNEGKPGWGYLEGGDILVLGKKILVGHSGNCSNAEGVHWLQHMLGPDYDIELVNIDKRFSHLDCVMLTPREGVAVVVPTGEPHDRVSNELNKRKFEVIRLPHDAVYCLGGSFRCAHQPFIRQ